MPRALNLPLTQAIIDRDVRLKTTSQVEADEAEKENEQIRMNGMDELTKKRYLREKRRKAQKEADLKPEVMMREEIDLTKRRVNYEKTNDPIVERIRGYVHLEGQDGEGGSDYHLSCRFNDL